MSNTSPLIGCYFTKDNRRKVGSRMGCDLMPVLCCGTSGMLDMNNDARPAETLAQKGVPHDAVTAELGENAGRRNGHAAERLVL